MSETGVVLWLTGLPASGKSTLARELLPLLTARGFPALLVDSDDFREVLIPEPTYSSAERDWFYGFVAFLVNWLARQDMNVVVAATGPKRAYREKVRIQVACFAEVHVICPLDVCRARDPKGIYALAEEGRAPRVPGIGTPYEAPERAEATVSTAQLSPPAAAQSVMRQLESWLRTCGHQGPG